MDLYYTISNLTISKATDNSVTADSSNLIKCHFTFTGGMWEQGYKYVIFACKGKAYIQNLNKDESGGFWCYLPDWCNGFPFFSLGVAGCCFNADGTLSQFYTNVYEEWTDASCKAYASNLGEIDTQYNVIMATITELKKKIDENQGGGGSIDYSTVATMISGAIAELNLSGTYARIEHSHSNYVEKVEGKGLSTNDFTNEDKAKLLSFDNYDDTEIKETLGNKLDKFAENPHIQDLIVIANSDGTVTPSSYTLEDVRNFVPCVKNGINGNIPYFVNDGYLADSGCNIEEISKKPSAFTTNNLVCFDFDGNLSDSGCKIEEISKKPSTFYVNNLACFDFDGNLLDSGHKVSDFLTEHQDISGKEDISNKVTSISSTSTDTEYPSAKCVYDLIGDLETLLGGI